MEVHPRRVWADVELVAELLPVARACDLREVNPLHDRAIGGELVHREVGHARTGDIRCSQEAREGQPSFAPQLCCGEFAVPGDVFALRQRRRGGRLPSVGTAFEQVVEGIAAR